MISSLRGTRRSTSTRTRVVIEVGGVGLHRRTSRPHVARATHVGDEVHAAHEPHRPRGRAVAVRVRDHATSSTVFDLLLGVTGVGPKSALGVLSALSRRADRRGGARRRRRAVPPGHRASGRRPRSSSSCSSPASSHATAAAASRTVGTCAGVAGVAGRRRRSSASAGRERVAAEAVVEPSPRRGRAERRPCRALLRLTLAQLGPARARSSAVADGVTSHDHGRARRRDRTRLRGRAAAEHRSRSSSASTRCAGSCSCCSTPHASSSARPTTSCSSGPPGLGKTTLAMIVAHESDRPLRMSSGPAIQHAGDLAALLSSLVPGEVLFIDEIHRMARSAEEMLYLAMEDFRIDIMVGKGAGATSIPLDLAPFTLVGATTRSGLLPNPLRDRFGFTAHLEFYDDGRARAGARRARPRMLGVTMPTAALAEIAARGRGAHRASPIDCCGACATTRSSTADPRRRGVRGGRRAALELYDVDALGLDRLDRAVLRRTRHAGSAAGPSASTLSPSRWARRPRRSSRSSSRSSCASGSWAAPRAAGSRRPTAYAHLGRRARPDGGAPTR